MKRLFFILAMFTTLAAHAQLVNEICNNGQDDDGNGLIDCFDGACAALDLCKDNYIHNVGCEIPQGIPKPFDMTLDWESPTGVVNHLNRVSIGDLDRDGIPEVVGINVANSNGSDDRAIYILNGKGGQVIKKLPVNYNIEREPLIGNIDNDGCAEIFTYGQSSTGYRIYAYDCNLNLLWKSADADRTPSNPFYLSLADFDNDGKVEIYYKDEIVDAHTGVRIISSSICKDAGGSDVYCFGYLAASVAVDMDNDKKLELVAGLRVYSVNLGARTRNSGSLTLINKHDDYRVRYAMGGTEASTTSIADFNKDGSLDVLATGSDIQYTDAASAANLADPAFVSNITRGVNKNTTVFFWDVKNNVLKKFIDPLPGNFKLFDCNSNPTGEFYKYGWQNGTGRINIGDTDGDGNLNAVYVSGKYLYSLKHDWTPQWPQIRTLVNEETSGWTGCTMFDFNGDGKTEIVYRDEQLLYIINGQTGLQVTSEKCRSRTNREYPIVADLDADGSTEICVTCAFDDNISDSDFCNQSTTGNQTNSVVRAYKSAADPWVPARRLWNQHGYFNVNINDNLSIPREMQRMQQEFPAGSCNPGGLRPLNKFLNQSPFLDSYGCPNYAGPNFIINLAGSSVIEVEPPTCPTADFKVKFAVQNIGDLTVSGDLKITFYKGNPDVAGAKRLNTITQVMNSFGKNSPDLIVEATVQGDGSEFDLYIVLNDGGTTAIPITMPNTNFTECNYSHFNVHVTPIPVTISTTTKPDIECTSATPTPDNGAVSASIIIGGVDRSGEFTFYWSNGGVAKPIGSVDKVAAIYAGLPPGDYTAFAVHNTATCNSNNETKAVASQVGKPVKIDMDLISPYTNCKTPNASIEAIVNDGTDPINNFKFEWFFGGQGPAGAVINSTNIASNLEDKKYEVYVTDKTTGCSNTNSLTVPNNTVKPIATAVATDLPCSGPPPLTGTLTGAVTGSPAANYTFNWYKNSAVVKPLADFTGVTVVSGVLAGNYFVVAEDKVTHCTSDPSATVVVKTANAPVLNNPIPTPNTVCDPALAPDGTAAVSVQALSGRSYTFQWFRGQTTALPTLAAPASITSTATTSTASVLSKDIYTVKVTDDRGCSDKKEVTILFTPVMPSVSSSATNVTDCTSPNGTVTITVSPGSAADYTYTWKKGAAVVVNPSLPGNQFTGLDVGNYTISAVHKTSHCAATSTPTEVKKVTSVVTITETALFTPSDCNALGRMDATVTSIPANINGFDISWYSGLVVTPAKLKQTDLNAAYSVIDISTGNYTVFVKNRDNNCTEKKNVYLGYTNSHKLSLIDAIHVKQCDPKNVGSIEVALTRSTDDGTFFYNHSNYDLYIVNTDTGLPPSSIPTSPQSGISSIASTENYNFASLEPGPYSIVAVANSTIPNSGMVDCESNAIPVEILQQVTYPTIDAPVINANTNCMGATANGEITLAVNDNVSTTEADFDYKWFAGQSTADPQLGVTVETASNLAPGFYTVEVTKNNGDNFKCTAQATYQVFENLPIISTFAPDLAITNVTMCPNGTGSAEVQTIYEDSNPLASLADYTFEWFRIDGTSFGAPTAAALMPNLDAGKFYAVKAIKSPAALSGGANCASSKIEFEILDATLNTMMVTLDDATTPTYCAKDELTLNTLPAVGTLTVSAASSVAGPLVYEWFEDPTATGPQWADVSGANGEQAINMPPNQFLTVKITNSANGCFITEIYGVGEKTAPIGLTASSLPITLCMPNQLTVGDGVVNAAVISLGGLSPNANLNNLASRYSYEWTGPVGSGDNDPVGSGLFTDHFRTYSSQPKGDYSVRAVDMDDPTHCFSDTKAVTITEEQVFPEVVATPTMPVTNCDATISNGAASANVGGDIFSYTFEWYEGTATIPAGSNFIIESPTVSKLKASLPPTNVFYTVKAINRVTQCSAEATVQIEFQPVAPAPPGMELLANVTNCIVPGVTYVPNGSIRTIVDRPVDYTFTWVKAGDPGFSATTDLLTDLGEGVYTVTAFNTLTHCESSASETIGVNRLLPIIDVAALASTCGESNGLASAFISNTAQLGEIIWSAGGTEITRGAILSDAAAGDYHVMVISDMGCIAEQDVTIGTEIHPYNGISRNGDDKNSFFLINCIDSFLNNNVKIFNRAGTLVYEAHYYNNADTFFDGKSNKGVSVMGTNLPDGTYFYIIDKGDGSKRLAGYLEIVN